MAERFVLQEFMKACNVVYPNGIAETLFQQVSARHQLPYDFISIAADGVTLLQRRSGFDPCLTALSVPLLPGALKAGSK